MGFTKNILLNLIINWFRSTPKHSAIRSSSYTTKEKRIEEVADLAKHYNEDEQFDSLNKETGEKLNVYNGRKYNPITKKCTGILHEKTLIDIQNKLKEKGFLE